MGAISTVSLSQETFIYRLGLLPGSSEGMETSPWAVAAAHEKSERLKSKWIHPFISPAPSHWRVCPCVVPCIHLCVCKYNRIIYNHSCRSLRLELPIPPPHIQVIPSHTHCICHGKHDTSAGTTSHLCPSDADFCTLDAAILKYKTIGVLCKMSVKNRIWKESSRL